MRMGIPLFAPLEEETTQLVSSLQRSVVQIVTSRGHGSGVIWHRAGFIVTNDHVVEGKQAVVEMQDGRRLTANVMARDAQNDLALLRVNAGDLPAAEIADARSLRVGELILAIGNPFGVIGNATLGIVSGNGGLWLGGSRRELLQADLELAPGNSGGPLADMAGRVVGVASMIVSPGIAVAVPSHVVQRFAARWLPPEAPAWEIRL